MADVNAATNILNGDLSNIVNFVSAAAGLGTAAMGLVDATKAFFGGPSNFGFGYIKKALDPFLVSAPGASTAFGKEAAILTLKANWLNGVAKPEQKAKAKALIHLGLTQGTAAALAAVAGVDAAKLTSLAQKTAAGTRPDADEVNVLGQFDVIVSAVLDAAYERADQKYRNASKLLAMLVATVLGAIGGWLVYGKAAESVWNYFGTWQFGLALLVGLSATPLAPIAKDLTTSLQGRSPPFARSSGEPAMTYFLNFRMQNVGGAVVDPYLLEGDGTAATPVLSVVPWAQVPSIVNSKNLLFATHGFNVSYQDGACSLGLLDKYLNLTSGNVFIGMLWPGDSWLPVVDYPFEGDVALDCGGRLASFCNDWCASAQSISLISHSLGARLVLEAVTHLRRRVRSLCLTAAAINRDCLTTEYADAAGNSSQISILASHEDYVLKVAFTIGDPFADLLHDDHSPFQAALGADGPPTPAPAPVLYPWQIPDGDDYGHSDYLPPDQAVALPPAPGSKWPQVADFMKRAFLSQPQSWPPP